MGACWWKERVFYQIYPRSFQDSNGDGIGDLRGILSRLDYLQWLGIGAVWLCPIYDSPNADMGYDIRDYEKIMEEFGTLADFDVLVEELHRRDIKLVMDLVVNHSSDEHAWFVSSRRSKSDPYRDYYIWRDGKGNQEPNNWASFFTPSAWSYDEETQQWYLHLFSEKQPDLNWENPQLRDEIYAMMNCWFDRGVDGFRMDVISLLAKAPGLPDGRGEGYVVAPEFIAFQPKLHEYLREMRRRCLEGRDCMCVGETPFVTPKTAASVLEDGKELDMLFQFELMDLDSGRSKWDILPFDLKKLKRIVFSWQQAIDWNTLFWGNHDQPRAVSHFGCTDSEVLRVRSAKALAVGLYLLRGTTFLYQGEEIGMTNFPFSAPEQLRDVESINFLKQAQQDGNQDWAWQGICRKGRDNARTPMQWDDSPNGGFTDGKPWLAVNPNYRQINVAAAMADPDSILHFYRTLIALRRDSEVLKYGDVQPLLWEHPQLFAYSRKAETKCIQVCCNYSPAPAAVPEELGGTVLLQVGLEGRTLLPYGAVVFRSA